MAAMTIAARVSTLPLSRLLISDLEPARTADAVLAGRAGTAASGGGGQAKNGPVTDSAKLYFRIGEPASHIHVICRRPRRRKVAIMALPFPARIS
jgi:hypothetical protein